MPNNDKIGLVYSTATGVVLRTINPTHREQRHLAWVQQNLQEGTSLLILDKDVIGADEKNCPNLDMLIPHVKQNHGITLSYGVTCAVVDENSTVVDVVLCCPVLYKNKLLKDPLKVNHTLLQKPADVGHLYDPITDTFTRPKTQGGVK